MLVRTDPNAPPEIQNYVQEIILENDRYKRELRTYHREEFVSPVIVRFSNDLLEDQHCMSRNISPAGISIISSFQFEEQSLAMIEIYRLKQVPKKHIVAVCRWCKPFGENYWMSGWQFMRLQNNIKSR